MSDIPIQSNVSVTPAVSDLSSPAQAPVVAPSDPKTILLVEDDPILSRMYSEKFKFEGYNVLHAQDGMEGLEMAQSQKADIILLDIMLPKLSGTDLLERLRSTPKGKDIPVVVLTNLAEKEEMEKARTLGAKEYLVKAMQTPEAVINTLKKYIQ